MLYVKAPTAGERGMIRYHRCPKSSPGGLPIRPSPSSKRMKMNSNFQFFELKCLMVAELSNMAFFNQPPFMSGGNSILLCVRCNGLIRANGHCPLSGSFSGSLLRSPHCLLITDRAVVSEVNFMILAALECVSAAMAAASFQGLSKLVGNLGLKGEGSWDGGWYGGFNPNTYHTTLHNAGIWSQREKGREP